LQIFCLEIGVVETMNSRIKIPWFEEAEVDRSNLDHTLLQIGLPSSISGQKKLS
jgi:hypothetical protein